MDKRVTRITAYSALAIAVLFLPTIAIEIAYPIPGTGASASELATFFADHQTPFLVSVYLASLGFGGLLIVFGAGLWAILRRAEGGADVWSAIAFAACVATAAGILVADTIFLAVIHRAPVLDPASLPLLVDAAFAANLMTAFPNAVYVIAAGIVIVQTGVMPRWIAHGAFLVAAIHLLSAMSLAHEGAFAPSGVLPTLAPLSHFVWLICVAVVLLRKTGRQFTD
ncbi:MAG: hypothetical protein HYR72_02685 [Deltaproteobacteria bacterium]|nr:hypothetical protein [Deltaproteobacteria bacterium]MBI3388320.1 hypothetical protein [Deltaproteobacteria bacterium]